MDIQTQLNFLTTKYEAITTVHAALITALIKTSPYSEDLLDGVEQSVIARVSGGDAVSAQNQQFAAEQFVQDELDRIRRLFRDLSR